MKNDIVKEQYREEVLKKVWGNDQSMIDYCYKSKEIVIRLSNGLFFAIKKPSIKKEFCFDDSFDYEGATKSAETARTSETYFKRENLEWIDKTIDGVLKNDYGYPIAFANERKEAVLHTITYYNQNELKQFEECDREAIAEAYRKLKVSFEKRINAYLKRYGMSKVHSWTFWGMA